MQISVNITQQHIDQGEKYECDCCPLALAIKELPGVEKVAIQDSYCVIKMFGKTWSCAYFDWPLIMWIKNFDKGFMATPVSVTIQLMEGLPHQITNPSQEDLLTAYQRYELLRTFNVVQFSDLYQDCLRNNKSFDQEVDRLIKKNKNGTIY